MSDEHATGVLGTSHPRLPRYGSENSTPGLGLQPSAHSTTGEYEKGTGLGSRLLGEQGDFRQPITD